jgi:selenide,water dikinase
MPKWDKIKHLTNAQEIEAAYAMAEDSMATLNRWPATLFQKYQVGACTDVTGFGILGHATYLAQA